MKTFTIVKDNNEEVKLLIKQPDFEIIEEADRVYASKVASLVRQSGKKKLLLRQELAQFLKDNGVWTEEDEKKVTNVNKEIDSMLTKLRKGGIKLSEGRQIAIDIIEKRKDIMNIMNKRRVFDETTIEAVAEAEKIDYIIYACTVFEDSGEKYWESFEDMKNDKLSNIYSKAATLTYEYLYGVDDKFEQRLPENRWLKKYNFIDDDLNYIDRKTGERVDRSGNLIKDIQEEVLQNYNNLQGEIVEEQPFIDDDLVTT